MEQITYLTIDVNDGLTSSAETLLNIFVLVSSLSKRLIKLNFGFFFHRLLFNTFDLSTNFESLTFSSLKINVKTFDDCLLLLDGRFDCLSTLIIHVKIIANTSATIDNTVSRIINLSFEKKTLFDLFFHRKNFPN